MVATVWENTAGRGGGHLPLNVGVNYGNGLINAASSITIDAGYEVTLYDTNSVNSVTLNPNSPSSSLNDFGSILRVPGGNVRNSNFNDQVKRIIVVEVPSAYAGTYYGSAQTRLYGFAQTWMPLANIRILFKSIRIPQGCAVQFGNSSDYSTSTLTLTYTTDTPVVADLTPYNSVHVYNATNWPPPPDKTPTPPPSPSSYAGANYTGTKYTYPDTLNTDWTALDAGRFKSIKLPSGYAIQFGNGVDYATASRTLTYTTDTPVVSDLSAYIAYYIYNNRTPPSDKTPPVPTLRVVAIASPVVTPPTPPAPPPAPPDPRIHVTTTNTTNRMVSQEAFPHTWIGDSIALPNNKYTMFNSTDCDNACLNNTKCTYSMFNASLCNCSIYELNSTTTILQSVPPNVVMSLKTNNT